MLNTLFNMMVIAYFATMALLLVPCLFILSVKDGFSAFPH